MFSNRNGFGVASINAGFPNPNRFEFFRFLIKRIIQVSFCDKPNWKLRTIKKVSVVKGYISGVHTASTLYLATSYQIIIIVLLHFGSYLMKIEI